MDSLLIGFYDNIILFLIVTVRFLGFFVIFPVFGGNNMPVQVRVTVSLFIAAIIITSNNIIFDFENVTFLTYGILIIQEALVGLIIGFVVFFIISLLYYVGQLVDFMIGFSMVSVFDPVSQIQVPITGNLYYLVVCALMLSTNGHHSFFRAVFYSYEAIPIGTASLVNESLVNIVISMISSFFMIGYQIAMPVIGAILILDVVMGLITKTAPQMNFFAIGMPLKIVVGFIVIIAIVPMFINVSDLVLTEALKNVMHVIRGMMP